MTIINSRLNTNKYNQKLRKNVVVGEWKKEIHDIFSCDHQLKTQKLHLTKSPLG